MAERPMPPLSGRRMAPVHFAAAAIPAMLAALVLTGCDARTPSDGSAAPSAVGPTTAPDRATRVPVAPPRAPEDPTVAEFAGFRGPKPAAWLWQPPESTMRAANYVIPAPGSGNQAHLVVFQGIGGGRDLNIERWKGQFRTSDLRAVEPVVTSHETNGMQITIVELKGEYRPMTQEWFSPDQMFLAAIVETPRGDLQIRLTGDITTVEANREAFMNLVLNLRPIDSSAG
ncbi:MAG: hypothetical protein KF817_02745 [Phycisphaeraceae bacterium]|nr:hypothetical protein [Phycisphaeraceae bacterium]